MPAALTLPPAPISLCLPASWWATDNALLQLNALREGWFFEADTEGALLRLPDGSRRMPRIAWLSDARLAQILPEDAEPELLERLSKLETRRCYRG